MSLTPGFLDRAAALFTAVDPADTIIVIRVGGDCTMVQQIAGLHPAHLVSAATSLLEQAGDLYNDAENLAIDFEDDEAAEEAREARAAIESALADLPDRFGD